MSTFAIKAEGISKLYRLAHDGARVSSFREALTNVALAPFRRLRQLQGTHASLEDFWALRDVSFEIERGDIVGVIGRNGAGKSTLLKVLSRVVEPTRGQVTMRGRIASLLEVGTGFHPELTGRENIYLNGSILGMKRREIDGQFDEIVSFAEIEQFLDTPVKRYSSGMYLRLAFAVAAHLQPEILIVDEVLAVGDAEFQKKCLGKMREVSSGEGRTVLFVSHNMGAVAALCKRALLLEHGRVAADGAPQDVISKYLVPVQSGTRGTFDLRSTTARTRNSRPLMVAARVLDEQMQTTARAEPLQRLRIEVDLELADAMRTPMLVIGFDDARGERIFAVGSYFSPTPLEPASGRMTVIVEFQVPPLFPGKYDFELGLQSVTGQFEDRITPAGSIEIVQNDYLQSSWPYGPEMGMVLVPSRWELVSRAVADVSMA